MRIIFILLLTTQIGGASFWIGFGSHVLGDLAMKHYEEMDKEKEKEKKNELE